MGETLCWSGGKARGGRSTTEKTLCTVCSLHSPFSCSAQREKLKKKKKEFDVKTGKKRGQEEGIFSFL